MAEEKADTWSPQSKEAWQFLHAVISDLDRMVVEDARDERELLEGRRVVWRALALCAELMLDVDPEVPRLFPMTTPQRLIAGPNPDGTYDLCTITPGRGYRIRGTRGTSTYLGFQVMAGVGLNPRRSAAYVSDRDLTLDDNAFTFVIAPNDPGTGEPWVEIPADASAIVVRQYIADARKEVLATYVVESLSAPEPPTPITDAALAEQLTAMAWTALKLTSLHRTMMPELLDRPNTLVAASSEALGSENTTPDNLYMIGTFDLEQGEQLVLDLTPPDTRYWSVTLESIWHECLEPTRRRSSLTNAHAQRDADGHVRISVSDLDVGSPNWNWLDTGGRRRGFVIIRWLDNPETPTVTTTVIRKAQA